MTDIRLKLWLNALLVYLHSAKSDKVIKSSFPPNFLFGVGTSAYQIEGGAFENGKGASIWDTGVHTPGHIRDGSTGDVACDSYNKWADDIAILKTIKVQCYRFSVSWTRLFPNGTVNFRNPDGVRYYNQLIDGLIQEGIEPIVTMFHWDTPQTLQDLGGWASEQMVSWFVDYATELFRLFGDRVKTWTTVNEPANYCLFGYSNNLAPFLNSSGVGSYLCAHNVIKAHAKVYRLYEERFKDIQKGRIGITLDSFWNVPANSSSLADRMAAEVALEFHFGWFAWPIFKTGDYPASMRSQINARSRRQGFPRSRLPTFSLRQRWEILGSADFLGLNHYATLATRWAKAGVTRVPSVQNDMDVEMYVDPKWPKTKGDGTFTVLPESLRSLVLWVGKKLGAKLEIAITESGYNGAQDESLDDRERIDYLHSYLLALLEAIKEGANVRAYSWWSFIDNFEWSKGYTQKFGLYRVDFENDNRTRTPKKSAMVYRNIILTRQVNTSYYPEDTAI